MNKHSKHTGGHRHSVKRDNKLKVFFKKNKKYLLYMAVAFVFVICLIFVGSLLDKKEDSDLADGLNISSVPETKGDVQVSIPLYSDDFVLVTPAVEDFMNAEQGVHVRDIFDNYKEPGSRLDIGLPVTLSYKVIGLPPGCSVIGSKFFVSEFDDFTDSIILELNGKENSVDVFHLKTGTKYFYKIDIYLSDGNYSTVGGSFNTAAGPRFITAEGVYNFRDIGGWATIDGRHIKQGLLYRGCEVDGAVEPSYSASVHGVETMINVLGIKTDLDLRAPTDRKPGEYVLGADIQHTYYSAPMYSYIFQDSNSAERIRKVFSDLSDSSIYPAYLHCTYGQDRTGTVCYLLEALLGVDEINLMKEYQLSGICHGDVLSDHMSEFIGRIKALDGDSLQDKVEGYLLSIGVTAEEIENIRNIFLE